MSLSKEHLESPLGTMRRRGRPRKNPETSKTELPKKPPNESSKEEADKGKKAPKPTLTPEQMSNNGLSKTAQNAYLLFKRDLSTQNAAHQCGISKTDAESYIARALRLETYLDEYRAAMQKARSDRERERIRRLFKARGITIS